MEIPKNAQEALELALYLAVTAGNDEDMIRAAKIARDISFDMPERVIEAAMEAVEARLARERSALH